MRLRWAGCALLAGILAGGGGAGADEEINVKDYPDSAEGLQALVADLARLDDLHAYALADSLVLDEPAAWFKEHFAESDRPALVKEYTEYVAAARPGPLTA